MLLSSSFFPDAWDVEDFGFAPVLPVECAGAVEDDGVQGLGMREVLGAVEEVGFQGAKSR